MNEKSSSPPPVELSMKYLAWSVKEISENLKKLIEILENRSSKPSESQLNHYKSKSNAYKQDEIPF